MLDFGRVLVEGEPAEVARDERVIAVYFGTGSSAERRSARERPLAGGTGAPLLALEGVCADYGQLRALRDVSLEVGEGEVVAVIGANGAGKTTLARTISGLHAPSSGRILIDGVDRTSTQPHDRVALGVAHCQEGRRIFVDLTVRENLELGAYGRRAHASAAERLALVHELFPILEEFGGRPGQLLSGGQQQMLAIGRALMSSPRLLIFDEISIGLAPEVIDRLYDAIVPINELGWRSSWSSRTSIAAWRSPTGRTSWIAGASPSPGRPRSSTTAGG